MGWCCKKCGRAKLSFKSRGQGFGSLVSVMIGEVLVSFKGFFLRLSEQSKAIDRLIEVWAYPQKCVYRDGEIGISATNCTYKGRTGSPNAQAYLARPVIVAAMDNRWNKFVEPRLGEGQFRDLEALQGAYQYWRGRARGTTTGGSLNSYIDQAWSHLLDTDPPPFGPPTIISPHHIWNLVLVDELLFSLDGTDPKVIVYIAFMVVTMVKYGSGGLDTLT
ncbi:hypothetical protein BY996DRAFT_6419849 [Phakopsora pachyrhizi]|nr:hypothetical protein BY996DRAFT_6419849 [Phakopsora pachyrhizi]